MEMNHEKERHQLEPDRRQQRRSRPQCQQHPKSTGKGAIIAKSPFPPCNSDEKNAPPATPESSFIRITTNIPASLAEKIEKAARQSDGNRSAVLTTCLVIGLDAMEEPSRRAMGPPRYETKHQESDSGNLPKQEK